MLRAKNGIERIEVATPRQFTNFRRMLDTREKVSYQGNRMTRTKIKLRVPVNVAR
jgi:hypothetical protein